MTFAQTERAALCDLLLETGPAAPTLCEGWTTQELAAHLWIREADPLHSLGFFTPVFAAATDRRMERLRQEWSWPELVARLRQGPPRLSLFGFPGVDALANSVEFFVHHEDVRRAGAAPLPPRGLPDADEDALWRQLRFAGRSFFRTTSIGVVLERTDAEPGEDALVRVSNGAPMVTVQGRPSELVLYAFGRRSVADVHLVGEPAALDQLDPTHVEP